MKVRRIDWSPDEWIAGTLGMTLEEEAIYLRITMRIYSHGGALPSDPTYLAHLCGVRPQIMRRILPKLMPKFLETGGKLTSNRCETELKLALNRMQTNQFNGTKGGRPKGLAKPNGSGDLKPITNHQLSPLVIELANANLSGNGSRRNADPAAKMTEIWNAECGFAKARKPNPARKAICGTRWRDDFHSSEDEWRAYCQAVATAPHLRGENDRGWRADLDWVLKPANLAHIMEGRYAQSTPAEQFRGPTSPPPWVPEHGSLSADAADNEAEGIFGNE